MISVCSSALHRLLLVKSRSALWPVLLLFATIGLVCFPIVLLTTLLAADGNGELDQDEIGLLASFVINTQYQNTYVSDKNQLIRNYEDSLTLSLEESNSALGRVRRFFSFVGIGCSSRPRRRSLSFLCALCVFQSRRSPFTFNVFINSDMVRSNMSIICKPPLKYQHELMGLDDVEFYMVPDNYTKVADRLGQIRSKRPKFICLNDDFGKNGSVDPRLVRALQHFYTSYFPQPSAFELPPGTINRFLHMDELRAFRAEKSMYTYTLIAMIVLALLVLWVLYVIGTSDGGHRPGIVGTCASATRWIGMCIVSVIGKLKRDTARAAKRDSHPKDESSHRKMLMV